MSSTLLDTQREAIVQAMLPHIVFDGWSESALHCAADEVGVAHPLLASLFPNGPVDAVAFHSRMTDRQVIEILSKDKAFAQKPIPVKIKAGILKRFELAAGQKIAVRKGLVLLSLPQNAALGLKLLSESCDSLWQLVGDNSTDFNWYTKRMTLAGVYSATLLYWLNDESAEGEATEAFLDRRLKGVHAFGHQKQKLQQWFAGFNPLHKRYGSA
jgi:ubiquinone biosynthesis protein COQ9